MSCQKAAETHMGNGNHAHPAVYRGHPTTPVALVATFGVLSPHLLPQLIGPRMAVEPKAVDGGLVSNLGP